MDKGDTGNPWFIRVFHWQANDGIHDVITSLDITVQQTANSGLIFSEEAYGCEVAENQTEVQTLLIIHPQNTGQFIEFHAGSDLFCQ